MEKKELRPVTSLGMFDMLKGVTILLVIRYHSWLVFSEEKGVVISGFALFVGFFIAAGYGLRVRPFPKLFKQIRRSFLRPYLLSSIGSMLAMLFVYSFANRTISQLLSRGLAYLAGFVLVQMPPATYFGFDVGTCGPIWFLVSMAEAWILLNASLKHLGEKKTAIIALALCFGIPYYDYLEPVPFVLNRLFIAFPGVFMGYMLQKHAVLEKKLPFWFWGLVVLGLVLHKLDDLEKLYYLKPIRGFTDYIAGFGSVYIFTHLNRRYNFVVGFFEAVGHNSLMWLCLHTIEAFAAPWAYFVFLIEKRGVTIEPRLGTLCLFLARCLCIWIGGKVITFAKNKLEEKGINI